MPPSKTQRFVLIARHPTPEATNFLAEAFSAFSAMPRTASSIRPVGRVKVPMRILDSIHEDGSKLVEMRPEDALMLRQVQPGLKLVPEVFFKPAVHRPEVITRVATAAATSTKLTVTVRSAGDGSPVAGVTVVAFTDYAARTGDQGETDAKGQVKLRMSAKTRLERLYAYPPLGFWSFLK